MKTIAIINFKGGVGKTTISWILSRYISEFENKRVLMIDIDAQMSLTTTFFMNDDGNLETNFGEWYTKHRNQQRTILDALRKYYDFQKGKSNSFDFRIDDSFIYKVNENISFIPSIEDLYWLDFGLFRNLDIGYFTDELVKKIRNTRQYQFDYVIIDCPPNLTSISKSILKCTDYILVPINPDVFASKGVSILIHSFKFLDRNFEPKIGVFMNKARIWRGDQLTRESQNYWNSCLNVCEQFNKEGKKIKAFNEFLRESADIRRSFLKGEFPSEFKNEFSKLWNSIAEFFVSSK